MAYEVECASLKTGFWVVNAEQSGPSIHGGQCLRSVLYYDYRGPVPSINPKKHKVNELKQLPLHFTIRNRHSKTNFRIQEQLAVFMTDWNQNLIALIISTKQLKTKTCIRWTIMKYAAVQRENYIWNGTSPWYFVMQGFGNMLNEALFPNHGNWWKNSPSHLPFLALCLCLICALTV